MVTLRNGGVLLVVAAFLPGLLRCAPQGPPPPLDTRPFGKYFVRACVLVNGVCNDLPQTRDQKIVQTITIKQVGCAPDTKPCPDPVYPLSPNKTFFVTATSDSGLPVTQQVVAGNVSPQGGTGTQQYVVNGPGTIVIRATVAPDNNYEDATPVELVLAAGSGSDDAGAGGCTLFGPPGGSQAEPQIDLPALISLIGNPTPFTLVAQGSNTIFIYSSRYPLYPVESNEILPNIVAQIQALAGRKPDLLGVPAASKPFKVELAIPHASALGDLATRIGGLNYSQFTVQDIGADKVRVSATSQPDCATWKAFLTGVRDLAWHVVFEPPELKLNFLTGTDAATAFGALSGGSATGGSPSGGAATPSPGGAPSGASTPANAATITVNQPPGSVIGLHSDTTPCVVAGLDFGNSTACAPASGSGTNASGSPGAGAPGSPAGSGASAPKPPAIAAMNVAAGSNEPGFSDLLLFQNATAGDDAQIVERKRILAALDLPRPQMIINAWVMQNSTTDPHANGLFKSAVRNMVNEYNDAIEEVVMRGWQYVQQRTSSSGFFNSAFYSYISNHYVADNAAASGSDPQTLAQNFVSASPGMLSDDPATLTSQFGVCPPSQYCLGYTTIFQPLKPRLTDLLLTLMAADKSLDETLAAAQSVEGSAHIVTSDRECDSAAVSGLTPAELRELHERCRAIWSVLGLTRSFTDADCASVDAREILGSLITDPPPGTRRPRIYLACFREAVKVFMRPSTIGIARAAVADFLFHYKMSQQYPHEFTPYDLIQSANALNDILEPIMNAFNRDVVAFESFLRADVQFRVDRLNDANDQRCCVKRLLGLDKPSFFNDGLVTVRTISGQPTQVNTTSQSALNVSTAPALSNLAGNIATPGASSGSSPVAGVLGAGTQPGVSVLTGVLNSYQTSYAQIGRQLNLSVTARSLSTASSAEINVTLMADESAGGPMYSGGPQGGASPNTSRVAQHDVTTRFRVESLRLFEISGLEPIVERSRSRFPLLPPFVEIPYIGTIAGIPIPPAKEYHSSIAVMGAMVEPTAADIAYGLRFVGDQVVEGDPGKCSYVKGSAGTTVTSSCTFRKAVSVSDFKGSPIRSFHRSMLSCLATNGQSPFSSSGSLVSPPVTACASLSFDSVPRDAY